MFDENEENAEASSPKLRQGESDITYYDKPFDVHNVYSNALDLYGDLGNGPDIGKYAKFLANKKILEEENETLLSLINNVGFIIGHANDRYVLEFEEGFLGWVNPDELKVVNFVENSDSGWIM